MLRHHAMYLHQPQPVFFAYAQQLALTAQTCICEVRALLNGRDRRLQGDRLLRRRVAAYSCSQPTRVQRALVERRRSSRELLEADDCLALDAVHVEGRARRSRCCLPCFRGSGQRRHLLSCLRNESTREQAVHDEATALAPVFDLCWAEHIEVVRPCTCARLWTQPAHHCPSSHRAWHESRHLLGLPADRRSSVAPGYVAR